jgi:hypothetical protein
MAANQRLLIFESCDNSNWCTPYRENPTNTPCACHAHVWSQTIRISCCQRIATFCESPTDLDGFHYSWEKGIPDNIPSTSADRSAGPHLVSHLLSTKEVVGLSHNSVDSSLLGLPGPYHRHAIGIFNTCSQGPTDTGRGYNHLRAPPSLRLSNFNRASCEIVWNTYCRPVVFRPLSVYWSLYLRLAIANVTQILAMSSRVIQKVFRMQLWFQSTPNNLMHSHS